MALLACNWPLSLTRIPPENVEKTCNDDGFQQLIFVFKNCKLSFTSHNYFFSVVLPFAIGFLKRQPRTPFVGMRMGKVGRFLSVKNILAFHPNESS